jgi:hypothetical protein
MTDEEQAYEELVTALRTAIDKKDVPADLQMAMKPWRGWTLEEAK